jgi:hypothetical protein
MHPLTEIAPLPQRHSQSPLIVKPNLINLLSRHRLSMIKLSQISQVPLVIIQAMARNESVERVVAMRVLSTISQISGAKYTLDSVDMAVWGQP